MPMCLQSFVYLLLAATICFGAPPEDPDASSGSGFAAEPKLLEISGRFDGSGKFVFKRAAVVYEHKHWDEPTGVIFAGKPWKLLDRSPPGWAEFSAELDLSQARIIKRAGRDVIALEQTADGFDLYICDSPNDAAEYAVTIAIPHRE